MLSDSDSEYTSSDSEKPKKKIKLDARSSDILKLVQNRIISDEPGIIRLLKTQLLLEDRCRLFQLLEVYKKTESNTEEWLNIRERYILLFKESVLRQSHISKYSVQDESEEKNIKDNMTVDIKHKIISLSTTLSNKKIIYEKYLEYVDLQSTSEEKGKIKNWLNCVLNIPFCPKILDPTSLKITQISELLNKNIFGMKKVKDQLLVYVSKKIQDPEFKCSLALIGKPGCGKTHISRLIGKALDLPFEQISLGGITHPDFLKGHDYTYIGSQSGEIVKCLRRMKYNNGILFLDEFDKVSSNKDISSALLHITDPIQNFEFKDNFTGEIVIDLSNVWFVYSMNTLPEDLALRDRIYPIEIEEYTLEDKKHIVVEYLFPRHTGNQKTIVSPEIAEHIILRTPEASVRTIDFAIKNICDKIDFLYKNQKHLKTLNVSFALNTKIKFPFRLTIDIVDTLLN